MDDNLEYGETEVENVTENDKSEILSSIKLNDVPVEVKPIKKKRKSKVDSEDIAEMTDEEILDISSEEIQQIYHEISSFVEVKAEMVEDSGIKGIIPTNLKLLNAILGGGFIIGGLSTVIGNPGCGKTMLIIQSMGNAQLHYEGKIFTAMIDSEYATTTERMANLGIRYPKIKPYSDDITVEKVFKYLETICLFKEEKGISSIPHVIGWDSIANTQTEKEKHASDPKEVIGYRGRVYSLLLPGYIAKCSKYNICLLSVNQIRDAVQMGPFPTASDLKFMNQNYTVPGGKALKFNAFHFLEMRQHNMTKKDIEKYGREGLMAEIMAVKNKLFRPKIPIKVMGDFTRGFSDFWTNYVFLVDHDWIKPGAWNTLINYPTKKFRTKEAEQIYKIDADFKKAYDEAIDSAIYEQIIKPNEVDLSKEKIPDFWDTGENEE